MSVRVIGEVFERSRAEHAARLVLIAIADNAAMTDGVAFPGQHELQLKTRLSESAVRAAIRELEQLGELETRKAQQGRVRMNVYRVLVGKYRHVEADVSSYSFRLLEPFSRPPESDGRHGGMVEDGLDARFAAHAERRPPESDGRQAGGRPAGSAATTGGICADDRQDPTLPREEPSREPSSNRSAAADQDLADRLNDPAAAAALLEGLTAMGAGAKVRGAALADPQRALAWLDVARNEARTNPAGFVIAGLESGEWPSPRDTEALRSNASRQAWVENTSVLLDPEDAHAIVDEWDDDPGELAMWHQAVDEARERRERERATEAAA